MKCVLRWLFCALLLAFGSVPVGAVSVSSFTPAYGSAGSTTPIVIKGTGFYPGTVAVKFNTTWATVAVATTADGTTIQAEVPAGATTGPIEVWIYANGAWSSAASVDSFLVVGPGPYVASFSPTSGGGGATVTLTGANFTGVTSVTFNGKNGTGLAVTMDNTLTVNTPAAVTTGPIVVKSPVGTFTTSSNFWVPPVLNGFTPTSGRAGTNMVVTGTNFTDTISVLFAGSAGAFTIPASFIVLSNRALRVTAPNNVVTGQMRIITPAGSATSTGKFTVAPVIYSQSPSFGPAGTVVTLTGANFNVGTPTVRFNGKLASAQSGLTFDQVKATVPASVTTGPVSITTTDGSYTNLAYFYAPATITSVSSSNSPPGSRIQITGVNFLDTISIGFSGLAAASFTVTNNTTIGVTVPPGVPTGPVLVTTPAGSVASSALFYGLPVITGFSPTHGLPGTNVTVYGSNLLGATSVSFGGQIATFTATNNGFLMATVPTGAVAGPIRVGAPGGTNLSSAPFVLDYSDIGVSVTALPAPVFTGSNLTYTIRIFNNGPAVAPGVTLTNRLPGGVSVVSAQATQGTVNTGANLVTGLLGEIVSGGECIVTVVIKVAGGSSLTNTASVASSFVDPVPGNNTLTTLTSVLPLPLLSLRTSADQVSISWPLVLSNYTLQYAEGFGLASLWTNITRLPIRSNDLNTILETNTRPARFYRLISP